MIIKITHGKTNSHGTQKAGEPWNKQTVKGWKLACIKMRRDTPGYYFRWILYRPSGACWYFDVFNKRKELTKPVSSF